MTHDPAKPALFEKSMAGFRHHCKRMLLHPEMSPEQVALSFAIGFAMAWNPLIGLHTTLILLLCLVFKRLHRPLMLLACFINNPWTVVPMATVSTIFGKLLLGRGYRLRHKSIPWDTIGLQNFITHDGFREMMRMLKPILTPYLLGGSVLCVLSLPIGYVLVLRITRRLRSMNLRQNPGKPSNPTQA